MSSREAGLRDAIRAGDLAQVAAWITTGPHSMPACRLAVADALAAGQVAVLDALMALCAPYLDPVRQGFLQVAVRHQLGVDLKIVWEHNAKGLDEHRRSIFRCVLRDDRYGPAAAALATNLTHTQRESVDRRDAHLLHAATLALLYDAWDALVILVRARDFPTHEEMVVREFWESLDDLVLDAPAACQDVFLAHGPEETLPQLKQAQHARQRASILAQRPASEAGRRPRS